MGYEELKWDIDNRDPKTTWLRTYNKEGDYVGYIELTLKDLFELIENMIDNMTNDGLDDEA